MEKIKATTAERLSRGDTMLVAGKPCRVRSVTSTGIDNLVRIDVEDDSNDQGFGFVFFLPRAKTVKIQAPARVFAPGTAAKVREDYVMVRGTHRWESWNAAILLSDEQVEEMLDENRAKILFEPDIDELE